MWERYQDHSVCGLEKNLPKFDSDPGKNSKLQEFNGTSK